MNLFWQRFKALVLGLCLSVLTLVAGETQKQIDDLIFEYNAQVRAFLLNDQRIQWSGLETTFSAEAVLNLLLKKKMTQWQVTVNGELFINQPFNKNILIDEYRSPYKQNFVIDTFSVKQLFIQLQKGVFSIKIGKFNSPFGRNHVPSFCNALTDQPFIRIESIIPYDTGLCFSFTPSFLHFDMAVVNGSEDQDTNSAKALIARLGLHGSSWSIGLSGKYFGDRGSETQKQYSDHAGIDMMVKSGALTLSGELISERYGLLHPLSDDEIFWPRSFYYRDINYQLHTPIKGTGGYLNLQWQGRRVSLNLNYGEFHPQKIDNPLHDAVNRRLLASCTLRLYNGLHVFVSTLIENDRPRESVFSGASPYMFLAGLHFTLRPAD
jgi:hypothetical protein